MLFTFLDWLRNRKGSQPERRSRCRHHVRPYLEPLEDRLAPATFTIVNTLNAGAGAALTVAGWTVRGTQSYAPHVAYAGAILKDAGSALSVTGSTFTDSRVTGGSRTSEGGALANLGDSTAFVARSAFTGNQARG